MDKRVYDPVFASGAGLKTCPACDKAGPAKCVFHAWVERKLAQYERRGWVRPADSASDETSK